MYRLLVASSKVASFLVSSLLRIVSKTADVQHAANAKARSVRTKANYDALRSAQAAAEAASKNLTEQARKFGDEVQAISRAHG